MEPLIDKPRAGAVLMARVLDKVRPVVVLNKGAHAQGNMRYVVVPVTTSAPYGRSRRWQVRLQRASLPIGLRKNQAFAVCDALQALTLESLGFVRVGGIKCAAHLVLPEDLVAIRWGVARVLGIA